MSSSLKCLICPVALCKVGTFEEAREDLIDAIELWVMSALMDGDEIPVINGCRLAVTAQRRKASGAVKRKAHARAEARTHSQTASVGF